MFYSPISRLYEDLASISTREWEQDPRLETRRINPKVEGVQKSIKNNWQFLIPVLWDCRSDSVLGSFSFRVIKVGRIIEKMSDGRVNMEATESRAKEEKPEV